MSLLSINTISDIRQIETILSETFLKVSSTSENNRTFHIPRAKNHIEAAINDLVTNNESLSDYSEIPRLQFIFRSIEKYFYSQKETQV